jgi:hypothetical protein
MKPLQSAPFTEEDWKIWRHVVRRFGKKTTRVNKLAGWSFDSDFRDAALMLTVEQVRAQSRHFRPRDYPHYPMSMTLMLGAQHKGEEWP